MPLGADLQIKNILSKNLYKLIEFVQSLKKQQRRFLVVDIGQAAIAVIHIEILPGSLKLLNYATGKISPTGKDAREESAVSFINNFLKANSISDKGVLLSISESESMAMKYLALPVIPDKEILEAARWQLKDEVPFDLEGALIDWQPVREYVDEEGTKKNGIIFMVVKKETVDSCLVYMVKSALEPLGITCPAFNYSSLIKYSPDKLGNVAVLDIDYQDSTLSVYASQRLSFSRKLPFSLGKITQSLTGVLTSDKGKIELSTEEAEKIRETVGIPLEGDLAVSGNIHMQHIISLMRPALEVLVRELGFSLDYFASNLDTSRPTVIYLTGEGANLKNLDKYLNKELNIEVAFLPLPGNLDTQLLSQDKFEKDRNRIMNALAAALKGPQEINLLPFEVKTKKVELIEKSSLTFAAVAGGTIILLLLTLARLDIWEHQRRLEKAEQQLKGIEVAKVLKQKIDLRQDLLSRIQKSKVPALGLLKTISATIPQQVILNELSLNQTSHELTIKGIVLATEEVANSILTTYIQQLQNSSFVSEAYMVSSAKAGIVQKFEINCYLVIP